MGTATIVKVHVYAVGISYQMRSLKVGQEKIMIYTIVGILASISIGIRRDPHGLCRPRPIEYTPNTEIWTYVDVMN